MSHWATTGEILAHCIDAATRCMDRDNSPDANESMKAAFGEAARVVSAWGLTGGEVARIFLGPMQVALAERFAIEDSCRIYWEFFDAFWLRSWSCPPPPRGIKVSPPPSHPAVEPSTDLPRSVRRHDKA